MEKAIELSPRLTSYQMDRPSGLERTWREESWRRRSSCDAAATAGVGEKLSPFFWKRRNPRKLLIQEWVYIGLIFGLKNKISLIPPFNNK